MAITKCAATDHEVVSLALVLHSRMFQIRFFEHGVHRNKSEVCGLVGLVFILSHAWFLVGESLIT